MTILRLLAGATALMSAGGCASIVRGTSQDFTIDTDPPGAHAALSTGETCEATPCTIRRSRNETFTVTVSKEGYQTTTHEIRNPWSREGTTVGLVGNFFLGGAIGVGVDAATGANRDLTPNPLIVMLEAAPEQVAAATTEPPAAESAAGEPAPAEPNEAPATETAAALVPTAPAAAPAEASLTSLEQPAEAAAAEASPTP